MSRNPNIKPESLALMQALLARSDAAIAAQDAFRRAYPVAPQAMIDAAVFHVISDGIEATVDWLAAIERFLRDPSAGLDYGAVSHVIYHLYNWQQFQALLPMGREGLKECLKDVQDYMDEGDPESARRMIKQLIAELDGQATPPEIR